jgi:ankyrin repeat protein
VKKALDSDPSLLKVRSRRGLGPLQFALTGKDPAVVKVLQAAGCDIKAPAGRNECAFHLAALGSKAMVDYVATQGVKPTITQPWQASPYYYAIRNGNRETAKALIAAKIPMETLDDMRRTPLLEAIRDYELDIAGDLFAAGANTNVFDVDGAGPIGIPAQTGPVEYLDQVYRLVQTIKEVAPDGTTPLHLAVLRGKGGCAQWLLGQGADSNVKNKKGQSPKDLAMMKSFKQDRDYFLNLFKYYDGARRSGLNR